MKSILLILIFFFTSESLIFSQTTLPVYIFAGAGVSMPVTESHFYNSYSVAPSLTGGLGFKMSDNILAKVELGYNHFYLKDNSSLSGLTIISYLINLNIGNFKSKHLTPYAIAGMGAFTLSDFLSTQTNIGFNLGAGISGSYQKSFIPYAEIQFNYNMSSGIAKGYLPVRIGLIFSL